MDLPNNDGKTSRLENGEIETKSKLLHGVEYKDKLKSPHATAGEKQENGKGLLRSQPMDLETVYDKAGGMGRYQWMMFIFLSIYSIFSADAINLTFVAGDQDHWCQVDQLRNLTQDRQKYIAIPKIEGSYDKCRVFNVNYSGYSLEDLVGVNRSVERVNVSSVSCSSWQYDTSVFTNTITSRFNLVCDSSWKVPLLSTLFMAGILLGSLGSGILSDRYGRRKVFVGSMILKVICCFLATFSVNYPMTAAVRLLVGLFNVSAYLAGFVLLMEIVTRRWRNVVGLVYASMFSVGFMSWPALAYFIRDDVTLQLCFAVAQAVSLLYYKWIDESPRWLLTQHRYTEANQLMKKIARFNNSPLPHHFDVTDVEVACAESDKKTWLDLMRSPVMRGRMLVLYLYWFTVSLMYYALSLNTGSLSGSVFVNTALSGAVEIPANLVCMALMGWPLTGRRLTSSLSLLVAGLASYLSIYMIIQDIGMAHTLFATVAKGFVTLAFSCIYVYTSEIVPTEVRNIGVSTSSMCARVSGMAAHFVGGSLGDIWRPLPSLVCGTFAVASGLSVLYLPETINAPLLKTIKEAEKFGTKTVDSEADHDKRELDVVA